MEMTDEKCDYQFLTQIDHLFCREVVKNYKWQATCMEPSDLLDASMHGSK
jgi:hypothetical protein